MSYYNQNAGNPYGGGGGPYGGGGGGGAGGPYGGGGHQQQQQQQQQQGGGGGATAGGGQWQQQPTASTIPTQTTAASSSSGAAAAAVPSSATAQAPPFNIFNPAMAATVMSGMNNPAMMNIAQQEAGKFIAGGLAKMVPGLERFMVTLRPYFAVDNWYVQAKLRKVLFPFLTKNWRRMEVEAKSGPDGDMIIYAIPKNDENSPDLYLPAMSLVTYVLLSAYLYGTSGKFNPEVIPDVMTKCFITQLLEVIAIRVGFYTMQAPCILLDLFSYTGYKYLGLCLNMVLGLVFGHKGYYIGLLWTASAASYFLMKVMANNIPRHTAATGPKRELMVLGFGGSQFATMWFLSETKFLS